MTRFQKLAAIAALAIGVVGAADSAAACGYATCWGAVGIGPTGAAGYSFDYGSEGDAIRRVQAECGGRCTEIKSFYNTCGAMAQGNNGAWGFGWASTLAQAKANAVGYCRQNGSGCAVRVHACTG